MDYKLGNLIRSLRLERGWSQEYLAKKIGVSTANINLIEKDKNRLRKIVTVNKILETFNIEFDFLFRDYLDVYREKDLSGSEKILDTEMNKMDLDELKTFYEMIVSFVKYKN